ncbi:MAG: outer membrane protein assembly factor BamE [Nevskiales bacterium]
MPALAACTYFRLPILQGNIVDAKKAEQVQPGMSQAQVAELLGTPLVQDSFNANRWDYVVIYRDPKAQEIRRTLSIYFTEDKVSKITGLEQFKQGQAQPDANVQKDATLSQPTRQREPQPDYTPQPTR